MIGTFERAVAFRYLRSRRQEGFVSVTAGFSLLGICLGVAALIIVMSVMNGFRHELIGRILGVGGHVTVFGDAGGLADYEALARSLQALPGVSLATPVIQGQVLATGPAGQAGVVVRALRAEHLAAQPLLLDSVERGRVEDFGAGPGVMVGSRLAYSLGLRVGGEVTLISPRGFPTAFGTMPRSVAYPVAAVFEVGMYEFDAGVVIMPLAQAQTFFRFDDRVTQVELRLDEPERPAGPAQAARRLASAGRVVDWQQSNSHLYGALQVERNVMFLILTLIILVAAFNIISGLIMLVKDKNGDIAIMRTMGATRRSVLTIFLVTGASIGVVGTLVGLLLGILFCAHIEEVRQFVQFLTATELFPPEVYFLSRLPARLDWGEVAAIVAMTLGLTLLATLYPAWRASRVEPADALRYE